MEKTKIIPKQVIIEVSSKCQLRCVGCPINGDTNSGKLMDLDLFKSIVDRVDFDTTIIPWMNGEPLLHPDYAEMLKYITDRNHRCYITTNGMLWNEDLFQHITDDNSCYQLIISLDGLAYTESITKARPGTDAAKVLENINRFGELKLKKKSNIDFAVKICQRGQDWDEVENYIGYWLKRDSIDYVCYGKMLSEESQLGQRSAPCQYFDNNFLILRSDGSSRLCAYNDRIANGNENPVGILGPDESLIDFYNNEAFTHYRRQQNVRKYEGPCATCGFAYTGYGMQGTVQFRAKNLKELGELKYHQDYYNQFFSLKNKKKPDEYYY